MHAQLHISTHKQTKIYILHMFRMAEIFADTHNRHWKRKPANSQFKFESDTWTHACQHSKVRKNKSTHSKVILSQACENICADSCMILPNTCTVILEFKKNCNSSMELLTLNAHRHIHKNTTSCPHSHTARRGPSKQLHLAAKIAVSGMSVRW